MKIVFRPERRAEVILQPPVPSSKVIPSWFSSMSRFTLPEDKKSRMFAGKTNHTVKTCVPFLDSLMTGYTFLLENDVYFELADGGHNVSWRNGGEGFIAQHPDHQLPPDLKPEGYSKMAWKWQNLWVAEAPKGYSAVITHPLNRIDLPFYTLSGVVDVDTYKNSIQFPFFVKSDFQGVIEAGTPIAQMILFKRIEWQAQHTDYNELEFIKNDNKLNSKMFDSYKKQFWQRKTYK